ncbi:ribosome maturation factor RimM [Roseococcus sp. YIM B11640]|uniref:ribosome maturation factor RimM n=1 Tax=Roseococcus sp. YIM B11640 TaxID=3133973 RepID=UPI003C7B062C
MTAGKILLGEIGRPHGVRGLMRVRSFTATPEDLVAYGLLTDETGTRSFSVEMLAPDLMRIEGVSDRDAASRLTGTRLYVARDALPPPSDPEEFYLADLEGLSAFDPAGRSLGVVTGVEDYGAGVFLTLRGPPERLVPFTRAVVPEVDLTARRIVVLLPEEVVVEGEGAA